MSTFCTEYVFAAGVLFLFGACGAGVVSPFTGFITYPLGAAPLAGILVVPLGTLAFYTIFGLSFTTSALVSVVLCLVFSALTFRAFSWTRAEIATVGGLSAVTLVAGVLSVDTATLVAHVPAIFYMDGTDHAGYGQLADWLAAKRIDHAPQASPDMPYESWPAIMFNGDPRFGSVALLAVIAQLHGASGVFSYDIASVVVLAAAAVGVGSIYTQTPLVFGLMALGLLTSHWFDYAHLGFFGKLVSYPSTLFVAGLALRSLKTPTVERASALALLSGAAGIMHSGIAVAILLIPILVAGFVSFAASLRRIELLIPTASLCGIAVFTPILATGVFARPLHTGFPDWGVSWSQVLLRSADRENQFSFVSGLSRGILQAALVLSFSLWLGCLGLAIWKRNDLAIGVLGGAAVLILAMRLVNAPAAAFQLIGFFYPALLCGVSALIGGLPCRTVVELAALVISIGLREPRFVGALDRYALAQNPRFAFSRSEFDQLAQAIGSNTVEVDITEPHPAILVLTELGRRSLPLQWSDAGWRTVLGYRGWANSQKQQATLVLREAVTPSRASHFELTSRTRQ